MGRAIGIDFGTNNTVVSYFDRRGNIKQLQIKGRELIPTVLYFNSRDDYIFGGTAWKKMQLRPRGGAIAFKTMLGDRGAKINITSHDNDKFAIIPRVAANLFINKIVNELSGKMIKEFGPEDGIIDKMVITVPAKFNDVEREAVRKAAAEAMGNENVGNVKLALEPTAAAIAAIREDCEADATTVLVYDFGGGTFDVSLIKKERDVFKQITADGDKQLGGNDLTGKLMAILLERVNEEYGTEFPLEEDEFDEDLHGIKEDEYKENMLNLYTAANQAKEDLSEEREVDVDILLWTAAGKSEQFSTSLTRAELEETIRCDIEKTVDITCRVLEEDVAKMCGPVDMLVLAGGSSRIPLVRQLLRERLPQIPLSSARNVSTLISNGAAILAQDIEKINSMTSQVTSARIGVSATDGVQFNKFQMIIPENEPLPCQRSKDFRLAVDGQNMLDISYYEYDVKKNPQATVIGDEGIQEVDILHINLPAGLRKEDTVITVKFNAASDGSLDVDAIVTDADGNVLQSGSSHVARESNLG